MNKEEFIIDEKIYENYEGSKIKIVFSNLGRRYKKIGEHLYLMLEKEELKLEDKLTAMVRIEKENEEIDRKKEIEKIKQQTTEEIRKIEETKNSRIAELEKELQMLKELYEQRQKEKEEKDREQKLLNEINQFKEKLEIKNEELEINNIDIEETDNYESEDSETYTEILTNTKNLEINEEQKINEENLENTHTEINTLDKKENENIIPKTTEIRKPIYYKNKFKKYNEYDKWIPKQIVNKNYNFLDLDCVIDTEKTIQLWIGYMTKQLLDNNINITDAPEYIEKTLIGSVKLWFSNLTENSKKVLRTNKPIEGTSSTTTKLTPIELLTKYETAIKDEFGSTTTIEEEQDEEKDTNKNLMLKLAICNMCYIDEYICAFKEYYYKRTYNTEESKEIRKLYFNKLPEPFSSKIIKSWEEAKIVDTLGARIKFLQQWYRNLCEKYREELKMERTLIRNLACCKNKIAPQFGCEERYYKKRKIHKKYKKYKKSKYKYKNPRKRYYVKNYKYERPYRKKKSIKECICYNCGKLGHLARDCKLPKNSKNKQISEIKIDNTEYMQIDYIDYELESEDSIYEISENETDNEIDSEIDESND
jgi:hypothetical protein